MDEAALHEQEKQMLINMKSNLESYIKKNYPVIYKHILEWTNGLLDNYKFNQKLCYFIYDLKQFPTCKICGKICDRELNYQRCTFKEVNLHTCCKKCSKLLSVQNAKQTMLERYGVTNVSMLKEIQDKKKKTCLKHYGVENPSMVKEICDKRSDTILQKFGTRNVNELSEIKEKIKQTCLERYGVTSPMHCEEIKEKIKKANLEKYGSEWYLGTEDCLRKTRETVLRKYGVQYINQTEERKCKIREYQKSIPYQKRLEWVIDRYESLDHVNVIPLECFRAISKLNKYLNLTDSDELKERILIQIKRYQDKIIELYGTLDLTEEKIKKINKLNGLNKKIKTNLDRYGVKDYNETDECKKKIIQTCLAKFGTNYYTQSEEYRKTLHNRNMTARYNYFCNNEWVEPMFTFDYYINGHEDDCLKWKCKKCGCEFEDIRHPVFHNLGRCLNCYPKSNNISKQEKEVLDFVKSIGIKNIIENTKTFIPHYELDFVCPDNKIAIEFDGVHWHTTEFVQDHKYHLTKTQLCEQKGFQLIHIFENEWINKKDICKSRIKSLFGIYDNRVYARKCDIRNVSQQDSKLFLETNHLQGNVISSVNIGLYYNDELVSLMTFGGYRVNLGRTSVDNEYELLRFCNKLNTTVVGGAGKLLKYFIKTYSPKKIISYADRRWSIGKLYEKLGFTFVRNTEIGYYYNIKDELENRFNWRKSVLSNKLKIFEENLTEVENMKMNGYYQIFDCGSKLYELIL